MSDIKYVVAYYRWTSRQLFKGAYEGAWKARYQIVEASSKIDAVCKWVRLTGLDEDRIICVYREKVRHIKSVRINK